MSCENCCEALAEVERLRQLLDTMDHFAEVAETCERKTNEAIAREAALGKAVEGLADEWDATTNPILRSAAGRLRKALRAALASIPAPTDEAGA